MMSYIANGTCCESQVFQNALLGMETYSMNQVDGNKVIELPYSHQNSRPFKFRATNFRATSDFTSL